MLLTAWDGLTAEEAATLLGIKPAALRKRISRARAAIDAAEVAQAADTDPEEKP